MPVVSLPSENVPAPPSPNWTLVVVFTPQDFQTSHWAGGVTTQLAIGPQGTHYADRDFLWRISSAQVALDHSVFTHLPDYHRFLTDLEGELELQIASGPK